MCPGCEHCTQWFVLCQNSGGSKLKLSRWTSFTAAALLLTIWLVIICSCLALSPTCWRPDKPVSLKMDECFITPGCVRKQGVFFNPAGNEICLFQNVNFILFYSFVTSSNHPTSIRQAAHLIHIVNVHKPLNRICDPSQCHHFLCSLWINMRLIVCLVFS